MKHFAHFLRHPLIRIFLAPLGFGIYGLIVVMYHTTEINWLALGYLYLILVSSQLIDHYFFVRFNTRKANASSPVILYAMEILLWAATVGFMWQHHWGDQQPLPVDSERLLPGLHRQQPSLLQSDRDHHDRLPHQPPASGSLTTGLSS